MTRGGGVVGKAWSIRTHFLVFGAALVLPLAALAGALLLQIAERDRSQVEQRALQIASGIAADLDRELERRITILQTLATLPALAELDLAAFHHQASAALQRDRTGVFLIDRSFQQKLNTYVPFGTALPTYGAPETAGLAFGRKAPQVSDYFVGRVTKRPAFDIDIPVLKDGEAEHVLAMGLEPFILQPLLQGSDLPRQWIVSIADRQGIILARSRDQDRFVGTTLPPVLSRQRPGTALHTVTLENETVLRATALSRLSGWQVAVNLPVTEAEAALRTHLLLLGIWSAVALLMTAVGAAGFARMVARPLQSASRAAAELAHDRAMVAVPSHVTEVNTLVSTLQRAGNELSTARARQRLLLDELSHRVKNLLSVVIAMTQSSLASEDLKEAREPLTRRLFSLARSHDLILASRWKGAPLAKIVEAELGAYAGRVQAQGPDIVLSPQATQAITMILHELATNAAKYGALSVPQGQVRVTWMAEGVPPRLKLLWQELGGPSVRPPTGTGFGTALLEGALPEATTRLSYDSNGFAYVLDVPVEAVAAPAEPSEPSADVKTG